MQMLRFVLVGILALALSSGATFAKDAALRHSGEMNRAEVEKIIHRYIVENPEVLVEADQQLKKRELANAQDHLHQTATKWSKALFFSSTSPREGASHPRVYLVEFFDYQCTYCKKMAVVLKSFLSSNPTLQVIFKELPIYGGTSTYAAKAALAAVKQNKYYDFHYELMADKGSHLTKKRVMSIAKSVGIDTKQMMKDMQDPTIDAELEKSEKLANAFGVVGTPTMIVSNQRQFKSNQHNQLFFIPGFANKEMLNQIVQRAKS